MCRHCGELFNRTPTIITNRTIRLGSTGIRFNFKQFSIRGKRHYSNSGNRIIAYSNVLKVSRVHIISNKIVISTYIKNTTKLSFNYILWCLTNLKFSSVRWCIWQINNLPQKLSRCDLVLDIENFLPGLLFGSSIYLQVPVDQLHSDEKKKNSIFFTYFRIQ